MRSIWEETSSFGIAACFGYLDEPDGGVDGEGLVGEGFDGDAVGGWEEETPEVLHSHGRDGDVGCGSTLWENAIIGTIRVLGYNTKSQGTNCAGARLKILPSRW